MVIAPARMPGQPRRVSARRLPFALALAIVAGSLATLGSARSVAAWDGDEPSAASERELVALFAEHHAAATTR